MTETQKLRDQAEKFYEDNLGLALATDASPKDWCREAFLAGHSLANEAAQKEIEELKEEIRSNRVKPDDYMELVEQIKTLKNERAEMFAKLSRYCGDA